MEQARAQPGWAPGWAPGTSSWLGFWVTLLRGHVAQAGSPVHSSGGLSFRLCPGLWAGFPPWASGQGAGGRGQRAGAPFVLPPSVCQSFTLPSPALPSRPVLARARDSHLLPPPVCPSGQSRSRRPPASFSELLTHVLSVRLVGGALTQWGFWSGQLGGRAGRGTGAGLRLPCRVLPAS